MDEKQREGIIQRHHHSVWLYDYSPQALFWENRRVQELRFDVLLTSGIQTGESVLDVGCGFADFYHYMLARDLQTNYAGIDLSSNMIQAAREKAPELTLFEDATYFVWRDVQFQPLETG